MTKALDLINFAISNDLNAMTFSLDEIKEIKKALDEREELKETIKQMQHNMRKDAELKAAVHEDSKYIFNEYCKQKEILEILRNHLYVASGLVELKITSKEYANIHKVKYHNGIPIVNQPAIDKINEWYYKRY